MHRISIAMSGGPNPAEIIDLVVLAELWSAIIEPPRRKWMSS